MSSLFLIRPPVPEEGAIVASIMRSAATPLMLYTTVIGCVGLGEFFRDQIAAGHPNRFLVVERDGALVGMSSWRRHGESLHLNYLYVSPPAQGAGIGTALLEAGLAFRESSDVEWLAVDVHDDNQRARGWYDEMGLTLTERRMVLEVPTLASSPEERREWSSTFHEEGVREHTRYGFSSFTLKTPDNSYVVGRLGDSLFRVTSGAIVHDATAMEALHSLDSRRALLCFCTPGELGTDLENRGRVLGMTERLIGSIDCVADRLRACGRINL